jgi:hypothetical protein
MSDKIGDEKFDQLLEHILNVDVEIFHNLPYDLYEKYHKIGNGELTIDDFTEDEINQLMESFKKYLKGDFEGSHNFKPFEND